ncbi:MAG: twin-arginine translocase TatA/TatE family subunit [Chloroflexi bacterium]|nr:twin-arginine translocase TatA/TatE family subunit [Chloroflexota bacterium]
MPTLGPTELIIILVIVVVLFGASRIGGLIGGVGKGIRQFRAEVREDTPSKDSPPRDST